MTARSPGGLGAIAPVRLPEPVALFTRRAERLEALSRGHATFDWLALLARIARGQAVAAREIRPAVEGFAPGVPRPLEPSKVQRADTCRRMLGVILGAVRSGDLPEPARRAVEGLGDSSAARIHSLEEDVLEGGVAAESLAAAPFVAAALQAQFASLAARLVPGEVPPSAQGCPVCGSPPIAGTVHGDDRLRYLACSLCGTGWHLPRVHCALCRGTAGLSYFAVDGTEGARAEACDRCRAYVKQFDLAKLPGAEPLADDAASLALDVLMAEEGFGRGGANLLVAAG